MDDAQGDARYRNLFESNPSPMWIYELGSLRFLAVNDAAIEQYGYSEAEFLEMTVRDIRPPEDLPEFLKFLGTVASGVVRSEHWRHRRKDGSLIEVEVSSHDIEWFGRKARMVEARDVTSRRRAEQRAHLLERAVESSSNGVVIVDAKRPDQPLIYVNAAFERMTGYQAQEVLGLNCRFLQGPDVSQPELAQVRSALREQRGCEVTLRNYTKQGALIWNQLSIAPVRDNYGEVTHFVGVLNDVTERRRYESELAYIASHDPVTGLSRYVVLQEQVEALIARGADGTRFALLDIDIDRFHTVNETMGHEIGDAALRVFADRLRECVGDAERVCRLAGDEFLALLPSQGEAPDPQALAHRIRRSLEAPVEIGPYRLYLTCSIGISSYPENGNNTVDLLRAAEAAMARAKRYGRDSVASFNNEQANELRDRLHLGGRLREAIRDNEMVLHYQPQVSALSGEIVGVEALVRWQTADLGLLPPGRFIRVAEELGLIVELGHWVLNEACRQLRAWLDAGLPAVPIAVNVSALQLQRPSFVDDVRATLAAHRLPAAMLEIELTESAIMENVQRMVETMNALKQLGVRLALDDFGIGFSSLNYLKRFPLDKLKIDQSFVREVSHSPGDAGIVRAVIAMGHQLRLTVMAEGVETEAQLGYLRRNHCDQLQGMFLGAPVPGDAAAQLLQQRHLSLGAFMATAPSQTLLVLDDDQDILRALYELLRQDGYRILVADNQQHAYDLLGRHPVQVIVADQRMPDGTGTEFLSRVKDLYPDTVRMVLSGFTDLASVTEAINRGAIYKILSKPWDDGELRVCIQEAFRMHAQQLEARVADRKAG